MWRTTRPTATKLNEPGIRDAGRSIATGGYLAAARPPLMKPEVIVPPPREVIVGVATFVPILFSRDVHTDLIPLKVDVRPEKHE